MTNIWKCFGPRGRFACRTLATAVLILTFIPAMHASYVTGTINAGALGGACGSVNGFVGEPCAGVPYSGPVGVDVGTAKVQTDFGLNRVFASGGTQASSEWMIRYALTGAAPRTPVNLRLELGWHVNLHAAAGGAASEFRMVVNHNTYFPFIIYIETYGYGNRCAYNPAVCNAGGHSGVWTQDVTAFVDPNNRLSLFVQASNFGGGSVDAYNTVRVNRIIVPDGIGWNYDGLAGNPLNFEYASSSAVPEPASAALGLAGLLAIGVLKRWRRAR